MAPSLTAAAAVLAVILSASFPSSFAVAAPRIDSKLLALRQSAVSAANCTSSSFTIPSWYVREFKTSSGTGTGAFTLQNRATGDLTDFLCQVVGEGWECVRSPLSPITALRASLKMLGETTASVQVQDSWMCNDRDPLKPISFRASGNATIPLVCDSAGCKSSNPLDLVRGSLLAPVSITPSYAEGPPGHSKAGCSAASEKPQWTLGTIIFLNETGDGAGAVATQSIQLQVTNKANGYVAGCLNYFNAGSDEDPGIVMNCGGGADFARRNRYSIQTTTVFYPRSWTFTINETWYCDDVDAAKPVSYTGTGKATLPLKCATESGRTACEADNVVVSGEVNTKTDLVPYSIEDPLPTADGCTISSIVSPSWTISNFEVEKNATTGASGFSTVAFNLKLNTKVNLFDYPVFVNHRSVELADSDSWYPCTFGAGEFPLAPKNCSFQYVEKTNTLSVNADWACMDLDDKNPIIFSGIATAKLPTLECEPVGSGNHHTGGGGSGLTRCGTKEGFGLMAEVANATWRVV